MAIVYGFAGVKIGEDGLSVDPFLPGNLSGYNFNFSYRGRHIRLSVNKSGMKLTLLDGDELTLSHGNMPYTLNKDKELSFELTA